MITPNFIQLSVVLSVLSPSFNGCTGHPGAPINPAAGGDGAFIGARGISLSGGQKARVALARAAYNPKAVSWSTARSTATPWFAMPCSFSPPKSGGMGGIECCKGDDILIYFDGMQGLSS